MIAHCQNCKRIGQSIEKYQIEVNFASWKFLFRFFYINLSAVLLRLLIESQGLTIN
jgi:hypothetical protein